MAMNTANTEPLSTVIGVFPTHEQADRAIDELRHTNFSYERIRVVEKGTGGFGETLKGLFTGQASTVSSTADNLVKMGMPEYEAQYYQHELDADHVLLLMNADDRPEAAFSIMRQNGAFDINSRLRVSTMDRSGAAYADRSSTRTDASTRTGYPEQQQAAYDRPTEQGSQATYAPTGQAPAAGYNAPASYDPNAAPVAYDAEAPADRATREAPRNA